MKTVKNFNELMANIQKVDEYIASRKDPEYSFALDRVKRGTCFVVVKKNGSHRFYPSRFVGYVGNSMDAHQENKSKDGRVTNAAISKIFEKRPAPNSEIDKYYKEYCESIGFTANDKGTFGVERKYWDVITNIKNQAVR